MGAFHRIAATGSGRPGLGWSRLRVALLAALPAAVLAAFGPALPAAAQPMTGRSVFFSGETEFADNAFSQRSGRLRRANRDYGGLPVGDWLVFSSLNIGVLYDTNLFPNAKRTISDVGLRIQPALSAARVTGIHDTSVYVSGDARFYKDNSDANAFDGGAGFVHRYEIQRDFIMRLQAELVRSTGNTVAADDLLFNGDAQRIRIDQTHYNQFYASSSLQKSFDRFFVGLGGSFVSTRVIDQARQVVPVDGRNVDGEVYTAVGRAGVKLSPVIYAFIDPSFSIWRYDDRAFDSTGTKVVAGLGSDRISLFQGEVYAGYQRQDFERPGIKAADGGVFGGKIAWYPTRDVVVALNADRSLGISNLTTGDTTRATVATTTSGFLTARFAATRTVALGGALGYGMVVEEVTRRENRVWFASANLVYLLSPTLGLNVEYQFTTQDGTGGAEDRSRITVGARAQF